MKAAGHARRHVIGGAGVEEHVDLGSVVDADRHDGMPAQHLHRDRRGAVEHGVVGRRRRIEGTRRYGRDQLDAAHAFVDDAETRRRFVDERDDDVVDVPVVRVSGVRRLTARIVLDRFHQAGAAVERDVDRRRERGVAQPDDRVAACTAHHADGGMLRAAPSQKVRPRQAVEARLRVAFDRRHPGRVGAPHARAVETVAGRERSRRDALGESSGREIEQARLGAAHAVDYDVLGEPDVAVRRIARPEHAHVGCDRGGRRMRERGCGDDGKRGDHRVRFGRRRRAARRTGSIPRRARV